MTTRHDQLMKDLLCAFPDAFLRWVAPALAERLDLDAVAFSAEEHYPGGPSGRARHPDLVARGRTRAGEEALLHVEIELRYRGAFEPRLLRYNRGLSLKYNLPVVSMVLYLRGGPPGAQVRVFTERFLGEPLSTLHYRSLGLSRLRAAEYLAGPEPLAWALAALMRPGQGQSRARLGLECLRRIAGEAGLDRKRRALLFECVLTYIELDDEAARELEELLAAEEDEEVGDMAMTWSERKLREGLEKGLEQGREQGREEGREALRDVALRLLSQRFGRLSREITSRVAGIESIDEMTRLVERVYQVDSLEELGLA